MKERIKTFFCALFLLAALPYIITMCFERNEDGTSAPVGGGQNRAAELRETADLKEAAELKETDRLDVEKYLIGVVADEIPMTYETEVLKAQAVIARTNVRRAMETEEELPESVSEKELLAMWGEGGFAQNYQRLADAIKATEGVIMTVQGTPAYAAFHAVSAGKTRNAGEALGNGDMPWLAGADSLQDIPSEDYLKVIFLEKGELVRRLKEKLKDQPVNEEHPLEDVEIAARDSADYVTQVKIGGETMSGEEFRSLLSLASACFYLKETEGKIRIVTKGLGHGLGMSQYGANELALEGMTYTDILSYYFKNVEISD